MSNISLNNCNQDQISDIFGDEDFENDDLVTFQHDSKIINFFYSQLTKYSKHIRESYLFSDVSNRFPQEMQKFQEESQLLPENIDLFFQLLQQNYNINENLNLTYIQCIDLLKISKFLEVRKLSSKINQCIKSRNIDVDFIIQMIQYEVKTQPEISTQQIKISNEIEEMLTSKINECFSNEKFIQLPIEIIYRIISKSSPEIINSNKLFDIITKSLNKFCVLFQFLELQKLSNDRLSELCEMYSKSNENTRHYFDYLKCNLNLINEMNDSKKNLEEMNNKQLNKMKDLEEKISSLQNQFNDSEKVNDKLQKQFIDAEKINSKLQNQLNEQQNKMKDLEASFQEKLNGSDSKNTQLQNQLNEQQNKMNELEALLQNRFNDSEQRNDKLQNQLNDSNNLNNEQKSKIKNLEIQITQLQKQLNEIARIKGQIIASVEKGLFINAEINLEMSSSTIDSTKSKVIISTSDSKCLGSEAYEKGEPITSLHMTTTFVCKPGRYYVRCIVFNSNGESNEILSNSVTTSVSSLTFDYKGEPAKISLPQGQYKLEVWGAKGGDSTGNGNSDRGKQSTVPGGLGGYSQGILKLNKKETVYVFVGEEGRTSNSSDGSTTKGGFPDGGGTQISYCSNFHTVPGTGGGSTSIRIGSKSNHARVIVAGGGGGASGDCLYVSPGGFGGGLSGGNCYYLGSLRDQGAGTQTGSTKGLSWSDTGDPGSFGLGASCRYHSGYHSGGGGGGGWYGGGGGGHGTHFQCSSGGGGSGWTFTESSMKTFQSGDSTNASKFVLTSAYYLADVMCAGGNEEFPRPDGNGKERGHAGHGYAKITPL